MHKNIAELWTTALKSGKYQQTRGKLRRTTATIEYIKGDPETKPVPPGMCCLGVLCEISNIDNFKRNDTYIKHDISLPEKVREWAGLKSTFGSLGNDINRISLSSMNDEGQTFTEIAEFIDKNYKLL